MYVVFFFSSRRRHTRFDCDWSSDVCSSDLRVQKRFHDRRRSLRSRWEPPTRAASIRTPSVNAPFRRVRSPRASARETTRRSEEHTSELQSQSNLVCRLLLEKKKTK